MTYQPGHSHPHTRFARACNRLSRGLAWVYDHTAGPFFDEWTELAELTDDNGEDISDVMEAVPHGTCDWGDCDQIAVEERWDDEDGWLPVCRAHAAEDCDHEYTPNEAGTMEWCQKCDSVRPLDVPGSVTPSAGGPGYFHDDAPTAARQAVLLRDGTLLMKTPGEPPAYDPREIDDTIVNLRPEPRSGAAAWATQLRRDHRPPPAWVQRILDAPIGDVRRALQSPNPDMYLWQSQQRRALAAA